MPTTSFTVQARLYPSNEYYSGLLSPRSGTHKIEIITLTFSEETTLFGLLSLVWGLSSDMRKGWNQENQAPLPDAGCSKIKKMVVEWEMNRANGQYWTEVHEGNVLSILLRLSQRQNCQDLVLLLY